MEISTIATMLQSGLSVVGFLALSFWMMKWAKGLHDRNKELGDIDKEIRAALKDSFVVQKQLHEIERKKLEIELASLSDDVGKKSDALDAERKILQATAKAIEAAEQMAREIHNVHIAKDAEDADKHFVRAVTLLDFTGIIKKETFFALDTLKPLPDGATLEQEIAWLFVQTHNTYVRVSAFSDAFTYLTPTAVGFCLRNPEATQQEVYDELKKVISDTLRQKAKKIRSESKGPGSN